MMSFPHKPLLFIVSFVILLTWCNSVVAQNLMTGDLLFQAEGKGDFSKAISSSTSAGDSLSFVHVGIIAIINDTTYIYEASPDYGVRKVILEDFLKNIYHSDNFPLVVIKRPSFYFSANNLLKKIESHLGEEYDWWYLPDNGKMYCSELVYECFRDKDDNRLFNARPMNFRNPDGSLPVFWVRLFETIGAEVPEGLPGTNPNDLYKDPRLIEIGRYENPKTFYSE